MMLPCVWVQVLMHLGYTQISEDHVKELADSITSSLDKMGALAQKSAGNDKNVCVMSEHGGAFNGMVAWPSK
jgi:hypothetical protein